MNRLQQLLVQETGFSEEEYNRFIQSTHPIHLRKKDYFVKAGQVCGMIGLVETGILRSFFVKDDTDCINDFFPAGTLVSAYTSFLTQTPAAGNIQALEDTVLCCISYTQLQQLYNSDARWYKFGKQVAESFFIRKCKKETSLLKDSALERYQLLLHTYPDIEQQVAQYHIASYLGIQPESLSRLKALTYINK